MATNNFKPFAIGTGANVLSQAEYEALNALVTGFTSGKASSAQINKAIRQATFIAAALAQYVTNKSGQDVLDDGNVSTFITKMATAFGKDFQALDAGLTSLAALAGGANMLPYYTAADVFSQTSLTAIGRSLIGQTTQAGALSYLGGAPLASPGLTGTPTAPTAAAGTSSTQLATTAFVQAVMAAAWIDRGRMPDGSNINTWDPSTTEGTWHISGSATVTTANGFPPGAQRGVLTVVNGGWNSGTRIYVDQTANQWVQALTAPWNGTDGPWSAWVKTGMGALADIGLGISSLALSSGLDWQNDDFVTGTINRYYWQAFTNPPTLTGPQPVGTSNMVVTVKLVIGTTIVVTLTAVRGGTAYESYDIMLTGAKGSRVYTVRMTYQNGMSSTVAVSDGGTGASTPEGARSNIGIDGLGIGIVTSQLITAFDWQQADFLAGSLQSFVFSSSLNPPSGITYNSGTSVTLETIQARGNLWVANLTSLTGSPGNGSEYTVTISGAKGSRTFRVTQSYNSDTSTVIPPANGGTGATTAEGAIQNLLVRENLTGIVGAAVNAKMTIATASATGTFTADEIIVADSLAGRQFRLTAFSASINLAIQGAGGMDTGAAPVNGFVALYAIYDLGTKKALLAVNATAAAVPEIYGGANMPSGYTASALLCVVPTDSTGKIAPLLQMGRKTLIATAQLSSTTAFISTPTALNISAAVPKNAKFLDGILYLVSGNSTRPVISVQPLSSPAVGIKQVVGGNSTGVNNTQAPFSDLAISTAQTIYWQVSAGVAGDTISSAFTYATGYSI